MSVREWLIAIGTLVIVGIVVDGYRRMRRARKDALTISSGMGADDLEGSPLDEDYNPELPNGGARPVDPERYQRRERGQSPFTKVPPKPTRPVIADKVPERFTPVEEDFGSEQGFSALDDEPLLEDATLGEARPVPAESADTDFLWAERTQAPAETAMPELLEPAAEADEPVSNATITPEVAAPAPVAASVPQRPLAGTNRPQAQEVIVINVHAREGRFPGEALAKLLTVCGLEHGDMDILHRHEENDTTTPVQFSVANAVAPGTFNVDDTSTFATPGISFFMSLPGPSNAMQAFDYMLETAQCVVKNFGGELKDERRSVMTAQTIEHCRNRIREYERKRRSANAYRQN
ncbi:MAG: cell division protein ZipA [Marinobacter sp.]|nr:cell division protein ZipA [Marinobacter sp.]